MEWESESSFSNWVASKWKIRGAFMSNLAARGNIFFRSVAFASVAVSGRRRGESLRWRVKGDHGLRYAVGSRSWCRSNVDSVTNQVPDDECDRLDVAKTIALVVIVRIFDDGWHFFLSLHEFVVGRQHQEQPRPSSSWRSRNTCRKFVSGSNRQRTVG